MPDDRQRPARRSVFGISSSGASPRLGPPLGPAAGGQAPWRRPSGSWRYRPAWFQPGAGAGAQPAAELGAQPAARPGAPARTSADRRPRTRVGTVALTVGACALAVAVLVAGALLAGGSGGPVRAAAPATQGGPGGALPAGSVVLTSESFTTALPAGWREAPAGLPGAPGPRRDERTVLGPPGSGSEPTVFIDQVPAAGDPIQVLAADELRTATVAPGGIDVDGPRLRTVAGAQGAALDEDTGASRPARRVVLILHGGRVFRLSLVTDQAGAAAGRQAVDEMLAAWRWRG